MINLDDKDIPDDFSDVSIDDDDVLDVDDDLFEDLTDDTCDLEKLNKPRFDDYKNAMTIYKNSDIFDEIVYVDENTKRGERKNANLRQKARIVKIVESDSDGELVNISLSESPVDEVFWICNRDLKSGIIDSGYSISC